MLAYLAAFLATPILASLLKASVPIHTNDPTIKASRVDVPNTKLCTFSRIVSKKRQHRNGKKGWEREKTSRKENKSRIQSDGQERQEKGSYPLYKGKAARCLLHGIQTHYNSLHNPHSMGGLLAIMRRRVERECNRREMCEAEKLGSMRACVRACVYWWQTLRTARRFALPWCKRIDFQHTKWWWFYRGKRMGKVNWVHRRRRVEDGERGHVCVWGSVYICVCMRVRACVRAWGVVALTLNAVGTPRRCLWTWNHNLQK